jgi:ATP-dependent 26S proteasome regulatory subunit
MNKQNIDAVFKQLANKELPLEHRKKAAVDLILHPEVGETALAKLANDALDEEAREMAERIRGVMENLHRAPMRPATFIELTHLEGSNAPLAYVGLDDGQFGYMVVEDPKALNGLHLGDRVALDGKATILLGKAGADYCYGKEVVFERRIDGKHLEVTEHDERMVVLAKASLMEQIESGRVKPGQALVLAPGDKVATVAVQADAGVFNYRFLDKTPIPDVVVERDIGAPPRVIEAVSEHVREEMTRPELRRRFKLRPCITRLLSGVSGSGKTLAVQAIHRRLYDIMSEVTGTPSEQLPPRVFRVKSSQVLSMWLGQSDKNTDRLFDEVEQLAAEPFVNKKGKSFKLPVMVVMEEAEGLGRARGTDHEAVYDRILTTMLQRLDPNRAGLSNQLVVFLSTTNEAHLVDHAFLRRIGGQVEHFGRLNREGFVAVLEKHITGLPLANGKGKSQKPLWRTTVGELESWLFDEENDLGVVQLELRQGKAIIKYRRDFLTGALIDRSVQDSAQAAWRESLSNPEAGLSTEGLQGALQAQINNVVAQLSPHNAGHYLDLPEGATVSAIRSI